MRLTVGASVALLFGLGGQVSAQVIAELDAFWNEVSGSVESGDFPRYSATYHPDAVVIFGSNTQPIATALASWESGFDDTRAGRVTASVQFRFSERRNDATTAHETGIFRYEAGTPGAEGSVQFVHFEALLVKREGWKMLMEFQRGPASQAEWEALGRGASRPGGGPTAWQSVQSCRGAGSSGDFATREVAKCPMQGG